MSLTDTTEQAQTETEQLRNSSFSPRLPNLQLAWDSTSYNALDKCPRFYQHSIIEGRTGAHINAHLKFGTIFHGATELYARNRAEGLGHDQSLTESLRYAIVETWNPILRRPWASEEPTKTRNTLFRSIVWYLDQFKDDSLRTLILANGKPAVEFSFRFDTGLRTTNDEPLLLCGHIDRIVEWNDEMWITDRKTTKNELDENYFKQFNPHNQVSIYSIAGIVALGETIRGLIIDGCQILVTGSRFRRQPIPNSDDLLEEWMKDFEIKTRQAEEYARENYWPMNRQSCGHGRFQCQFRPVCSSEPSMRPDLLEALYVRRTWDPLQPR